VKTVTKSKVTIKAGTVMVMLLSPDNAQMKPQSVIFRQQKPFTLFQCSVFNYLRAEFPAVYFPLIKKVNKQSEIDYVSFIDA